MKTSTLTKQRLARLIGQRTRFSNRVSAEMLDALVAIVSDHLAAGGRVEIANFLTLDVQPHTRLAKHDNEADNERMFDLRMETFFVLKCRPGKHLRYRLRSLARRH